MKKYAIIGAAILVIAAGGIIGMKVRSQKAVQETLNDLNSPKQLAIDECIAEASVALRAVFVETCTTTPAIDKDPANCADWGPAAIFSFMNEQSAFPAFQDALLTWNEEVSKCQRAF